jgi:hypothetical protein
VFWVVGFCLFLVFASTVFSRQVFLGPILFNLALLGAPAACVFSFALWYRDRLNVAWLLFFIVVFVSCIMYTMVVSAGRRPLLSIFLGPLLFVYGTQMRHWSRTKLIALVGVSALLIFSVSVVYAKFRWYSVATGERRTAASVMDQIRNVRSQGNWFSVFARSRLTYFGQENALFAMLTQRYITQNDLEPVPLNSLRFLIAYPIPRKLWPGKPEVIGVKLVRDVAHIRGTNWGLGVAGQAAYEGGAAAIMLYAFLLAFGVRFLDEPMKLQPGNPFLISMHASIMPHVIAIPRGDMGIMVQQAAQGVLCIILLGFVCRIIFGSKQWTFAVRANASRISTSPYTGAPESRVSR